ncbi:MAG: hypothetical protein K2N34_08425 [Lachnospiraceae bacterium]|nr:hypothetical protein [Lachnospiraceae bacterium]
MKKGVLTVLSTVIGVAAGVVGAKMNAKKKITEVREYSNKHLALFLLMNQWVKVKQTGKDIPAYLIKQGYKKIAIYGMNYVGQTLYDELKDSEVTVAYAIDKNADKTFVPVDILLPDDNLPEVDAIIITAITFFEEIERLLIQKTKADILSMEDILYEV